MKLKEIRERLVSALKAPSKIQNKLESLFSKETKIEIKEIVKLSLTLNSMKEQSHRYTIVVRLENRHAPHSMWGVINVVTQDEDEKLSEVLVHAGQNGK